jgi:hypothetical protein
LLIRLRLVIACSSIHQHRVGFREPLYISGDGQPLFRSRARKPKKTNTIFREFSG